uniref:Uncharacterized protein n=1 Tax=Panagrolaimus sp. ES5 TaxID=591445 RepID=A0AC34FXT0_9BILA
MKYIIKNWVIRLLIFCIFTKYCFAKQWTEDDEKRRIAKIKEDELRQFKAEMGSGRSGFGSDAFYGESEIPNAGVDYSGEAYPRYRASPQKYSPIRRPSITQAPPAPIFTPSPAFIIPKNNATAAEINWCFHCASPLRILSEPMQLAVQNLLDVRRAKYPKDAIIPDCNNPANIRKLPKQQCKHSYCQTLVLTEHERGVSFAIRGCAETFAAVDESILNERGDNQCVKLHGSLDLRECVCKNRKYCYRGETDDKIEAASKQIVQFYANAQNTTLVILVGV